jgi:hypothetical protein
MPSSTETKQPAFQRHFVFHGSECMTQRFISEIHAKKFKRIIEFVQSGNLQVAAAQIV